MQLQINGLTTGVEMKLNNGVPAIYPDAAGRRARIVRRSEGVAVPGCGNCDDGMGL